MSPIPACSGAKCDLPAEYFPPYFKPEAPLLACTERSTCAAPCCCMSIPATVRARPLCRLWGEAPSPPSRGIRIAIGERKAVAWHTAQAKSAVLSITADRSADPPSTSFPFRNLPNFSSSGRWPLPAWPIPDKPKSEDNNLFFQDPGVSGLWLGLPLPPSVIRGNSSEAPKGKL